MDKVDEIIGFRDKYINGSDRGAMYDEWCRIFDDLLSIATCIHHKETIDPEIADRYDFRQYGYLVFNDRIKYFDPGFMIGAGLLFALLLERYGFFSD